MALAEAGTLELRLISAAVLAPVALAAVWFGPPFLPALIAAAAAGMAWEWARLSLRGRIGSGGGAAMLLTAVAAVAVMALGWGWLAVALALLGSVAVGWRVRGVAPLGAALWAAAGIGWITLPCVALLWLAAEPSGGRLLILWLLAIVWATDTGAYAAGRGFGGPRLAPRLSPNKTWAGLAGGLLAAGVISALAAPCTGAAVAALVPAGLVLSLASQAGDLVESLAKRRLVVKEAGAPSPGHGGLLDRLDGMLTATAALSASAPEVASARSIRGIGQVRLRVTCSRSRACALAESWR